MFFIKPIKFWLFRRKYGYPCRDEMADVYKCPNTKRIREVVNHYILSPDAFHEGEVVAIFGVYPLSEVRYCSWGLVTEKSARFMLSITREVNKFFDLFKAIRVEAHVRADFEKGMRWMRLIGFDLETPKPMRKWGEDGHDYYQYARLM